MTGLLERLGLYVQAPDMRPRPRATAAAPMKRVPPMGAKGDPYVTIRGAPVSHLSIGRSQPSIRGKRNRYLTRRTWNPLAARCEQLDSYHPPWLTMPCR